jgi:hypothetical protein
MKNLLSILLLTLSTSLYSQCAIDTLVFPIGVYPGCFPSAFSPQTVSCENGQTWTVSQILQFEVTDLPVTIQMTSLGLPAPIYGLLLDECGNVIWDTNWTCLTVEPMSATGLTNQLIYTIDFQLDPGTYYWATYVPEGSVGCYLVSIGTVGFLSLPPEGEEPIIDELIEDGKLPDGKYFQEGFGFFIVRRGIKYNMYGIEIQ